MLILGVKKDVMIELLFKKEFILRVELSSKQKEYYKVILIRNYEFFIRKGGGQVRIFFIYFKKYLMLFKEYKEDLLFECF